MITDASIKVALRNAPTCGKTTIELKDDGPRGEGRLALIIRVAKSRITSEWYAVWWADGKRTMAKIGAYPTMSLGDARKAFSTGYAPVISRGENPSGPRARKDRRGVTVKDLFQSYVDHLRAADKASVEQAERVLLTGGKNGSKSAAKAIGGGRRAAEIEPSDIIPYLSEIHGRGAAAMAHASRAYIGAAFAHAMASENSYTRPSGSASWGIKTNPVTAIPTDPAARRAGERHLNAEEVRLFWLWLESMDKTSRYAPAMRLQLATGQRVTEILKLTDKAWDPTLEMLDWGKTKNGKPHNIPVPAQGVAILNSLQPNAHGFYFPSRTNPKAPGTICGPEQLVTRFLLKNPSIPRFSPRDCRRTWKTLTGAAGITKELRDKLQNHARKDVSSVHYDKWEYLPERREAMKVWSKYLARILAGKFKDNVLQLPAAAGG
jgi:integrase